MHKKAQALANLKQVREEGFEVPRVQPLLAATHLYAGLMSAEIIEQ